MNLYRQQSTWRLLLIIGALSIVTISLWYTNQLAGDIAESEQKKVELWANAYKNLNQADENTDLNFLFDVIKNNQSVPVILTNEENKILAWRNLDTIKASQNENYLTDKLRDMKKGKPPLQIEYYEGSYIYIYYEDSKLLKQLRYYPYVQFGIIGLFLFVAYLSFSTAKSAEQNQVWVGMAKETAHQLGTPISSLVAWVEYLKDYLPDDRHKEEIIIELGKDVDRLELIADRFSKIGSKPKLEEVQLLKPLDKTFQYIKRRSSDRVTFKMDVPESIKVMINAPLFEWVLENLLKNALDAMDGSGSIEMIAFEENKFTIVEIKDSGKGIPSSKFKTVFQPGYSTKKRGWGLGLTLTKRIIEQYHKGKIFVKNSVINEGTTFRIEIPNISKSN